MGSNVRLTEASAGKVKKRFEEEGKGKDFSDESWRPPNVLCSNWRLGKVVWSELNLGAGTVPGLASRIRKGAMTDSEPVKLAKKWKGFGPKLRQLMMDPDGTEVDDRGFFEAPEHLDSPIASWYPPLKEPRSEAHRRGWGTVHWDSYGAFLMFLEETLNSVPNVTTQVSGQQPRGAGEDPGFLSGILLPSYRDASPLPKTLWPDEQEQKNVRKFQYPVHAVGYNWIQSNYDSARHLQKKIKEFIGAYKKAGFLCEQVILVSHSMGGLVSRICQKMDKENLILGIIHGVMPATGAPLAYRRLVAGLEGGGRASLDLLNVLDNLAGANTYETTPVVANSPGALELLPSHLYPKGWLKAEQMIPQKTLFALPTGDNPYDEIYKQKDVWYRLVNPDLLDPAKKYGEKLSKNSPDKAWEAYTSRMTDVEKVHRNWLGERDYHKNTYVYYGEGESTFASIRWQLSRASDEFSREELLEAVQRRELGGGHGQREVLVNRPGPGSASAPEARITSAQVLLHDSTGDGTVPVESGQAPGKAVSNICRLNGFDHQGSYGSDIARVFSLLSIAKLTALSSLAKG